LTWLPPHATVLANAENGEKAMAVVTVSRRYQITIPREIREFMGIRPGQKIEVTIVNGHIVLIPLGVSRSCAGPSRA
jgi:AbrB family looped-hinge helix DNA binding protein